MTGANINTIHIHRENRPPAQGLAAVLAGVVFAGCFIHRSPFACIIFAGDVLVAARAREFFFKFVSEFVRGVGVVRICPEFVRALVCKTVRAARHTSGVEVYLVAIAPNTTGLVVPKGTLVPALVAQSNHVPA